MNKGLKLTPEMLEKAGFTYNDDDGIISYSLNGVLIWQRFGLDEYFVFNDLPNEPLDNIPQLQKGYLLLTGKELEV
jgi:hypothetical protein